jgi:hypothetical protein
MYLKKWKDKYLLKYLIIEHDPFNWLILFNDYIY